MRVLFTVLLVAALSACEERSAIVDRVESAGYPGDLTRASIIEMRLWLQNHHNVAADVARMCVSGAPRMSGIEVRLCTAAPLALGIPEGFHPVIPDPRTFDLRRIARK